MPTEKQVGLVGMDLEAAELRVLARLTPLEAEALKMLLENVGTDEGPSEEGWHSDKLKAAMTTIEQLLVRLG